MRGWIYVYENEESYMAVHSAKEEESLVKSLLVKTLLFILYGELNLTDRAKHTWTVKTGEYILFPKGTTLLFQTEGEARYIEFNAEGYFSPEGEIVPFLIYHYSSDSPKETPEVMNRTVFAGKQAILMLISISKRQKSVSYSLSGRGTLYVLKGSGEIFYKESRFRVSERQEVSLRRRGTFSVRTREGVNLLLLVHFE